MSKCSTLSHFIDQHLLNGWVETNLRFMECRGISFIKIHGYVDVISPILIISMACQATRAVKKSKVIFNVLSGITASVMLILIITFGLNMNFITNYVEHKDENVVLYDVFATVQTALIGYESLGVLGEEAKNPTKTIPRSITFAVKYILVFYGLLTVTMSFAVTEKHLIGISTSNPIGGILKNMELTSMSWISYVGTLSALWCSTYGSMFILIRMMYAMSRDGMIFKLFSKVDRHTHTLALPTTIFGLLVGVTATFVAIEYRVSFLSLLFAKIMTSVCLLITRYRLEEQEVNDNAKYDQDRWVLINSPRRQIEPTNVTHRICMLLIHNTVFSVLASVYCIIIIYSSKKEDTKNKFEPLGYISLIACLIFIALLAQQPTNNRTRLSYHIGGVPALPIITIASDFTAVAIICRKFWLWGFVWSGLGVVFYFSYSIFHSEERKSLFQNGTRWNPLKTPNTDNIQDSNLNQMEMDDEREYMKSTITDEPQPDEFAVTSYQ